MIELAYQPLRCGPYTARKSVMTHFGLNSDMGLGPRRAKSGSSGSHASLVVNRTMREGAWDAAGSTRTGSASAVHRHRPDAVGWLDWARCRGRHRIFRSSAYSRKHTGRVFTAPTPSAKHRSEYMIPQRCADAAISSCKSMMASQMGQTRTLRLAQAMSGLPPEADILAIPALFS